MKRALAMLLALLCAVLPAGAESLYSGQEPDYTRLAVLDGEVYCLGEPSPLWVNCAVYRMSPEEKTAVTRRWGGWRCLYAAGDRLLLVYDVLNIGEALGSHPASVQEAKFLDPATGRSMVLGRFSRTEKGTNHIFAAAGQVYAPCGTATAGSCSVLRIWMTAAAGRLSLHGRAGSWTSG